MNETDPDALAIAMGNARLDLQDAEAKIFCLLGYTVALGWPLVSQEEWNRMLELWREREAAKAVHDKAWLAYLRALQADYNG